jgi:pimeloyl-ACP methyl ester carboxylesterase
MVNISGVPTGRKFDRVSEFGRHCRLIAVGATLYSVARTASISCAQQRTVSGQLRLFRNHETMSVTAYRRLITVAALIGLLAAKNERSMGGEGDNAESPQPDTSYPNLRLPTLGGRQFWGDICHLSGWRIQHHVLTGHHRLLDPDDVRHAWGTETACRSELQRMCDEHGLAHDSGKVVIVVHGIIRSSKSFSRMRVALEQQGYTVVPFDYPSTQVTIHESAKYLERVIGSLEQATEINFVVHSMGGLLVRTYLRENPDPRIRRMVMLGVPNQGANMANVVQNNPLFKLLFGPAGQQLIKDPEGFIASLPTPQFEFAVIAGARGTEDGWNPLIAGDDDGTVEVANTKLPGAADFMTVCGMHSFLMDREDVIDATCRFLVNGALRETGVPQPIGANATMARN